MHWKQTWNCRSYDWGRLHLVGEFIKQFEALFYLETLVISWDGKKTAVLCNLSPSLSVQWQLQSFQCADLRPFIGLQAFPHVWCIPSIFAQALMQLHRHPEDCWTWRAIGSNRGKHNKGILLNISLSLWQWWLSRVYPEKLCNKDEVWANKWAQKPKEVGALQ